MTPGACHAPDSPHTEEHFEEHHKGNESCHDPHKTPYKSSQQSHDPPLNGGKIMYVYSSMSSLRSSFNVTSSSMSSALSRMVWHTYSEQYFAIHVSLTRDGYTAS